MSITSNTLLGITSLGVGPLVSATTLVQPGSQTVGILTLPPLATDVLVGAASAQTLLNKTFTSPTINGPTTITSATITDSASNVNARGLQTTTGTVSLSSATTPSIGQVLQANSTTTAIWQNVLSSVPFGPTTISSGTTGLTTVATIATTVGKSYLLTFDALARDTGTTSTSIKYASFKVTAGYFNPAAGATGSGTAIRLGGSDSIISFLSSGSNGSALEGWSIVTSTSGGNILIQVTCDSADTTVWQGVYILSAST